MFQFYLVKKYTYLKIFFDQNLHMFEKILKSSYLKVAW